MRTSIKVVLVVVAVFTALTTSSMLRIPSASAATGFVAETDLNGRDGPSLNANTVKVNMY